MFRGQEEEGAGEKELGRGSCCDSEKRLSCEQPRRPVPLTGWRFRKWHAKSLGLEWGRAGVWVPKLGLTGKQQKTLVSKFAFQPRRFFFFFWFLSTSLPLCKSYIKPEQNKS